MRPELVELTLECRRLRMENIRLRKELVEARAEVNETRAKEISFVCTNTSLSTSADDILNRGLNHVARSRAGA